MSDKIQNTLIVGGGTAGWMSACILSTRGYAGVARPEIQQFG